MITPVYSSLGRIRALIACSRLDIIPQGEENIADWQIVKKGMGEIIHLCEQKQVELHLFYDTMRSNSIKTVIGNVKYYPAPYGESLGVKWSQDFFHFFPINIIDYGVFIFNTTAESGMPTWIIEELGNEFFFAPKIKSFNDFDFPGGNGLMGYHKCGDYLLVGSYKHCTLPDQEISTRIGIPLDRIFRLPVEWNGKPIDEFFHLDLYVTIVGKTSKVGPSPDENEIILVAKPYGECDHISQSLNNLVEKIKSKGFLTPHRLPCIILEENGTINLFSYNNCFVENYFEENTGKRILNFYFPKFRKQLEKSLDNVFGSQKKEFVLKFNNSVNKAINSILDSGKIPEKIITDKFHKFISKEKSHKKVIKNDFLKIDIEDYAGNPVHLKSIIQSKVEILASILEPLIEVELADFAPTEIHFLEGDFFNEAQRHGSLHCISKVLKRDKVTLE